MGKEYKKVTITLPEKLLSAYRKLLDKIGINFSTRLAILIDKDMKKMKEAKEKLN